MRGRLNASLNPENVANESLDGPISLLNNETLKLEQHQVRMNASITEAGRCNVMCDGNYCNQSSDDSPQVKNCLICVRNMKGGSGPVTEDELNVCGHETWYDYFPNEWNEEDEWAWTDVRLGCEKVQHHL